MFEENSGRESRDHRDVIVFKKLRFQNAFRTTLKRKAGVFKFRQFEERFRNVVSRESEACNKRCIAGNFCAYFRLLTYPGIGNITSNLLLENTYVTFTIRGTQIFRSYLPFLRNVVENLNTKFTKCSLSKKRNVN